MTTILLTVHLIVALLLIVIVLMQRSQGADMGASFGGGGSQTLFGSGGSSSFLGKSTWVLATIFMVTSLSLAFFSQQDASSVIDKGLQSEIAIEQQIPAAGETSQPIQGGFNPNALNKKDDSLPSAE